MERGGAAGVFVSAGCGDFQQALRLSLPPLPVCLCPCRGVWSCRCALGREGKGGCCCEESTLNNLGGLASAKTTFTQ